MPKEQYIIMMNNNKALSNVKLLFEEIEKISMYLLSMSFPR